MSRPTKAQVEKLHTRITNLEATCVAIAMERKELVLNPDSNNSKLIRENVLALEEKKQAAQN